MVKKNYLTPSMDGEKKIRTSILCGSGGSGTGIGTDPNGGGNNGTITDGGTPGNNGTTFTPARERSVSSLD